MKNFFALWTFVLIIFVLSACNSVNMNSEDNGRIKIGIMLSDDGLGDQSFSDLGFAGLERARDDLNVSFDYREIKETKSYEQGFEELVAQGSDLIIGLGFTVQEPMEKIASKYQDQRFLLIDSTSELPNIHNVNFKEEEGSYLLGRLAAMKTESSTVGFIGGVNSPIIQKFEKGFTTGVKAENPQAKVLSVYSGSFGDDKLGVSIAKDMISEGADFLYPAAGFTGVGSILEAQNSGVYAFGVDSDQFFLAEDTVVSSMLKRVDTAIYNAVKELVDTGTLSEKNTVLGIKEEGVSLAPIRVINLTPEEQKKLDRLTEDIANGIIIID